MMFITKTAEFERISGRQCRLIQRQTPIAWGEIGALRAISSTFADSGIGERPHAVEQADFLTYLSPGGGRRICPTRDARVFVEIGAPAFYQGGVLTPAQFGNASRASNEIKWAASNYDLSVVHGGHFVKTVLELRNKFAPEHGQIAFPLTLIGAELKDRQLLVNGKPTMRLWPSMVYDLGNAGGEDDAPLAARDEIVDIDGQLYIMTTLPDISKMKRPALDPTLELQPDATAGYDTYVYRASADTSYATDYRISIIPSGTSQRVSLILWDISSIPAGSTIDAATIYLTLNYKDAGAQTWYWRSILSANSGWLETANWNYANGATATDRWAGDAESDGGANAGCSQNGTDFSSSGGGTVVFQSADAQYQERSGSIATADVQAWLDTGNYGMAGLSVANQINAYSSDEATAARRPKFVVDYTEAGGTTYYLAATLTAASATPDDPAFAIARSLAAALAGGSSTPDSGTLSIARGIAATLTADSVTPDNARVTITRLLAAASGAQTNTPDAITMAVARYLTVMMAGDTSSSGDVILGVARILNALSAAQTSGPDTATIGIGRSMLATLNVSSSTPDDVAIIAARVMAATLMGASVTSDSVILAVSRALSASIAGGSASPDDVALVVARVIASTLGAVSVTPDDVTLSITGIVLLAAALAAQSATPDDPMLTILRPLAAVAGAGTATGDAATLSILLQMAATLTASSDTTDSAKLAVERALSSAMEAQSWTPDDSMLNISLLLAATMIAISQTPDDVSLTVGELIEALFRGMFRGMSRGMR